MDDNVKLFSKTKLEDYFITQKKKTVRKIRTKVAMDATATEYADQIIDQKRIEPIELQLSESQTSYKQLTLDKDKYFVRVRIPYTGDKVLFGLYPAGFRYSDLPAGRAGLEYITLVFTTDISTSKVENERVLQRAVENLKKLVEIVNKEARIYNKWLDAEVFYLVERRIEKVKRVREVDGFRID